MASSFIAVNLQDTNARFAADLKRASQIARELTDILDGIVERGFIMLGDPASFDDFEDKYGLPDGTGQTVFDIVNGSKIALQANDVVSLRNRIG